jgi:hypothetical protein
MKTNDDVLTHKGCQKKIDLNQPLLNLMLWDYIVTNKSNMEFILMLNKIEESLVAPWLTFAQIFQLHGYKQYGI